MSYDPQTYKFYAEHAAEYAARRTEPNPMLKSFLDQLAPTSAILELGCGAGLEAKYMQDQGFAVTATEGNPELAKFAAKRLGTNAKVMRFDELNDENSYDGIWANMCLLHAPWDQLDRIIYAIHRALKPNGLLMASFKIGEGAQRDKLARYYNLPTQTALREKIENSATWSSLEMLEGHSGIGHDGTTYNAVWVKARR